MRAPSGTGARGGLLLSLLALACYTSLPPQQFTPAVGPHGVKGELALARRSRMSVELLEMRDSAYVVLAGGRVAIAPFRAVSRARFAQMGDVAQPFSAPRRSVHEALRMASRFPYGMPEAALAQLLAAGGQQAPDDASAPRTP